jgi:type II secretory pathway pseudopilin PulG
MGILRRLLNKRNNKGFTITELMVSTMILIFVSLALMRTSMLILEVNTRNAIRDEGTRVASQELDLLRIAPFDLVNDLGTAGVSYNTVYRQIRNNRVSYDVTNTVTNLGSSSSRRLTVQVEWPWKGTFSNVTFSTMRVQ